MGEPSIFEIQDGVLIRFYGSSFTDIVIPEVRAIEEHAFRGQTFRHITFSPGLREIRGFAFYNNSCLTELILPEGLERLEPYAFAGCCNLRKIVLPKSLRDLYYNVFSECTNLVEIEIPEDNPVWQSKDGLVFRRDGTDLFLVNPKGIRSLEIPPFVTCIPRGAFALSDLETIILPDSVKTIGKEAFECCSNLKHIDLPSHLEILDNYAFSSTGLKEIRIPDTVREIGEGAFKGCYDLQEVVFPTDLERIPSHCMESCRNLQKVDCPASLKGLGESAFSDTGLTEIRIPESVQWIGKGAFEGCFDLREAVFPSNLKKIPRRCMAGCRRLRNVTLPDHLETLSESAFQDTCLTKVVFPAIPKTAERSVFLHAGLQHIILLGKLPEGVDMLHARTIGFSPSASTRLSADLIPFRQIGKVWQDSVLLDFALRWKEGEQIPDDTRKDRLAVIRRRQKTLRMEPLFQNILLEEHLIGPGDIDGFLKESLEAENRELTARLLDYQNRFISMEEKQHLEDKAVRKVMRDLTRTEPTMAMLKDLWPGKKLPDGSWEIRGWRGYGTEMTVPSALKNTPIYVIGCFAFSPEWSRKKQETIDTLKGLQKVCISEGIQVISEGAFGYCKNLVQISIPSSVREIEKAAFASCRSLKDIVLPDGLVKLSESVFCYCDSIERIILPETIEKLGSDVFEHCKSLKTIVLHDKIKHIGYEAFYSCDSLEEVKLPPHLDHLGMRAFSNCSSIKQITLPLDLEEIPRELFRNCDSLKSVILPPSLKCIQAFAFCHCESLEELEIPEGVAYIDRGAFQDCINLKKIVLHSGLKRIGEYAFSNCRAMEEIELPEGLEIIEDYAFSDCANLKKVVLQPGLKQMRISVFTGCGALKKIKFPPDFRT